MEAGEWFSGTPRGPSEGAFPVSAHEGRHREALQSPLAGSCGAKTQQDVPRDLRARAASQSVWGQGLREGPLGKPGPIYEATGPPLWCC